jgi:GNAT superfamily N-acetyltransferase
VASGPSRLPGRVEANFVAHLTLLHRNTPGMRVVEGGGWVLSDSGLASDSFNTVYMRGLATPREAAGLREELESFRARGLPFAVWTGPGAPDGTTEVLASLGLRLAEEEPGLALDLAGWQPPGGSSPVKIQVVGDEARLAEYGRTLAAMWDPPDQNVAEFYRRASGTLFSPACPVTLLVGLCAGLPVATCEVLVADGVAGVYNVATLRAHQRRGIGTGMVVAALDLATRRGCDLASLQASAEGLPVYQRLGFRECCHFRAYQG